jgi:hypothetical protein
MQKLVNIYAQANVRIRINKKAALARIRLSSERAKAYWFYVDYPKGSSLSEERLKRKELMNEKIGMRLIKLFERIDRERGSLLDWIFGWPEERSPWENENVIGMFPSYFYYFMNGGGETGCMRFRTGDCKFPKLIQGTDNEFTYCYHMQVGIVSSKDIKTEVPIVRSWERYNFTTDMGIRLVAHEMGHAMSLQHYTGRCVSFDSWEQGNLMSQVRQITVGELPCRSVGYPGKAVLSTRLTDDQIITIRQNLRNDLRETPTRVDCVRVGKTVESIPNKCEVPQPILGFFASAIPIPSDGIVQRIRWKSKVSFKPGDRAKISVGQFSDKTWQESNFEMVELHSLGSFIHQEHDLDLRARKGDFIGLFIQEDPSINQTLIMSKGLAPQGHAYDAPDDLLTSDIIANIPEARRRHPFLNKVVTEIDANTIYPEVAKRSKLNPVTVMTKEGWILFQKCSEWIINYDLKLIEEF